MTRNDINNYQKASVERTNPQNAWVTLAAAPRRSYLGKYRRLTPSQSRWVRSLLNHWGGMYGGSGTEHLSGGGGMWSMILTGWTGEQQERIATVLSGLRKIGYTGDALFEQAKAIIWPKKSLSDLIGNAGDQEDYYTWRKTINDMARWMQYYYAPFLTEKQCIDRVRWCIELFNSAVFFTLKDEFGFENAKTCEKDLKTSFETA